MEEISESDIKCLLTCDTIAVRQLYNNIDYIRPDFDMILCTNQDMKFGNGDARRIEIIPFESIFIDNPRPDHPKEFKRNDISDKIDGWVPAFKYLLTNRSTK